MRMRNKQKVVVRKGFDLISYRKLIKNRRAHADYQRFMQVIERYFINEMGLNGNKD